MPEIVVSNSASKRSVKSRLTGSAPNTAGRYAATRGAGTHFHCIELRCRGAVALEFECEPEVTAGTAAHQAIPGAVDRTARGLIGAPVGEHIELGVGIGFIGREGAHDDLRASRNVPCRITRCHWQWWSCCRAPWTGFADDKLRQRRRRGLRIERIAVGVESAVARVALQSSTAIVGQRPALRRQVDDT